MTTKKILRAMAACALATTMAAVVKAGGAKPD